MNNWWYYERPVRGGGVFAIEKGLSFVCLENGMWETVLQFSRLVD